MRRDSLLNSYSIPIAGGLLATCLNLNSANNKFGFRQRDTKFYIELIVNWLSYGLTEQAPIFANSQISRVLNECVEERLLKVKKYQSTPHYLFTRAGIVEFITRLRSAVDSYHPEHFSFLVYFIETYADRVKQIILNNEEKIPPALLIEIDSLLNAREIFSDRVKWIDIQIAKLKERIKSSENSASFAELEFKKNKKVEEIANEIEKRWPYALNSVKRFSEVILDLDQKYRYWELKDGGRLRSELIWRPQLELLESYRRQFGVPDLS